MDREPDVTPEDPVTEGTPSAPPGEPTTGAEPVTSGPTPDAAPWGMVSERDLLERKATFYQRATVVLAAVALVLAFGLVAQLATGGGTPEPAATVTVTETPAAAPVAPEVEAAPEPGPYVDSPVVRRQDGDPMAIGAIDAPVVVTQWTDLRCPYCAAFGRETMPQILEEYVTTGLVRFEVNDVAFFGEQSQAAAVAARAAGAQGRYFEYLDAVAQAAPEGGHPDLPRETLVAFAEQAGVPDLDRFTTDLDDEALWTAVEESTAAAQYLGVSGVPFFVVGEAALSGAYPIDAFRQVLDEALATVGR